MSSTTQYNPFQPLRQSITDAAAMQSDAAQGAGQQMADAYNQSAQQFAQSMSQLGQMIMNVGQQNVNMLQQQGDIARGYLEPYRQAGMAAGNFLGSLLGIPTMGTGGVFGQTGPTPQQIQASVEQQIAANGGKFTFEGKTYEDPMAGKTMSDFKSTVPQLTYDQYVQRESEKSQMFAGLPESQKRQYYDTVYKTEYTQQGQAQRKNEIDSLTNNYMENYNKYVQSQVQAQTAAATPQRDSRIRMDYTEFAAQPSMAGKTYDQIKPSYDAYVEKATSEGKMTQMAYDSAVKSGRITPQAGTTNAGAGGGGGGGGAYGNYAYTTNAGGYNVVKVDPNYVINGPEARAKLQLGADALSRSQFARGMSQSGRAMEELYKLGHTLAATEIGAEQDRLDRQISMTQNSLLQMMGMGGQAAGQMANLTGNLAQSMAQANQFGAQGLLSTGMAGAQNTAQSQVNAAGSLANARLAAAGILSDAERARGQLDFQAWQAGYGPKQGVKGIGGLLSQIAGPMAMMGAEMGGLGGLGMLIGGGLASVGGQNFA